MPVLCVCVCVWWWHSHSHAHTLTPLSVCVDFQVELICGHTLPLLLEKEKCTFSLVRACECVRARACMCIGARTRARLSVASRVARRACAQLRDLLISRAYARMCRTYTKQPSACVCVPGDVVAVVVGVVAVVATALQLDSVR